MGFFSWKTSDTNESIANVHSDRECKTVYLLQPNEQPIVEHAYNGYGYFGGVNAFDWVAEFNIRPSILRKWKGELCCLGMSLKFGSYLTDKDANSYCHGNDDKFLSKHLRNVDAKQFRDYASLLIVEGIEASVNEHIENNRLIECNFEEFIKYPLKLSFNENAVYENVDRAESCDQQGFFY